MAGGQLPFGLAPSGSLTNYKPTLRERATDFMRRSLFSDDRAGQGKANRVMDVASVTPFGFGLDVYDAGREAGQGNLGAAGLMLGMAPFPGHSPKFVRNLKGEKVPAPRQFFRGTNPGDERRIKTGAEEWDNYLFAADNEPAARMYGSSIQQFEAAPDARILYEGTAEFTRIAGKIRKGENLLQYSDRAAKAARNAGYDAAWFQRQGDVGTAIFNPSKFIPK
jgi:hypothetical protein